MKVIRGQEAGLETSKAFYRGSALPLTDVEAMKIFEIRWKSSEDRKPTWNRAQVSKNYEIQ